MASVKRLVTATSSRAHLDGRDAFRSIEPRVATLTLLIAIVVAGWLIYSTGAGARAAEPGEVAFSTLEMTPIGGKLYREARVPVEWRVEARITAPFPEVPKVRPIKAITAGFPKEMTFVPDPALPVCPDRILSPVSTNIGIPAEQMIGRCPRALIGNGRARLYLAANNAASGTQLNGTELVIFYGGRTSTGTPRLKVYGYDREVNAGVYMEGTWKDNVLEVSIPKLPFGTSTGFFELAIPGRNNGFPGRVGRDPGFVRASCPKGFWAGTSEFLLGDRLDSGEPIGEEALIRAPDFRADCVGLEGRPAIRLRGKGGSKSVGRKSSVTVVVSNPGTATARDVKVRFSGRGVKATPIPKISSLAPGASRKVSTKVSFSRKGRTRIRIAASGRQLEPSVLIRSVIVR